MYSLQILCFIDDNEVSSFGLLFTSICISLGLICFLSRGQKHITHMYIRKKDPHTDTLERVAPDRMGFQLIPEVRLLFGSSSLTT